MRSTSLAEDAIGAAPDVLLRKFGLRPVGLLTPSLMVEASLSSLWRLEGPEAIEVEDLKAPRNETDGPGLEGPGEYTEEDIEALEDVRTGE